VETLRPDCPGGLVFDGATYESTRWRESLDAGDAEVLARYEDGGAALVRHGRAHYLATLADDGFLTALFAKLCAEAGIAMTPVGGGLRLRRRGDLTFGINYGETPVAAPAPADAVFVLGGRSIAARSVDLARWPGVSMGSPGLDKMCRFGYFVALWIQEHVVYRCLANARRL
jgi:beta-galactosidase